MNAILSDYNLLIFLLSPIILYFVYLISAYSKEVEKTKKLIRISGVIAFISIAWGIYLLWNSSAVVNELFTLNELGFSLRLDPLNLIILGMISIIGLVVLSYSFNYLDGDPNQNRFLGNMSATIAAVHLFVLSENLVLLFLAWVLTSLHLNKLLRFYSDRRRARIAARKKFLLARVGDLSMLVAFYLIYMEFGSANLTEIFSASKALTTTSLNLEIAMSLLAVTAILKSAQVPLHGWLIEVMEAPTPVSALLHAGLINAGPFLMIRFSDVLAVTAYTSTILFVVGGLSALFGALVYSTQTSVKTALGYSSVAHMGFTMMICGLGVYSASLLHLTAHSFYKAHAFLSSGSVVDSSRIYNLKSNFRTAKWNKIIIGFGASLVIFGILFYMNALSDGMSFQYMFVASIIFLAVLALITSSIDSVSSIGSILNAFLLAAILVLSFFGLEYVVANLISTQVPELTSMSLGTQIAALCFLPLFALTVLLYLLVPYVQNSKGFKKIGIHLRNGLYLNLYFDKLIGALQVNKSFQ